MLKRKPQPWKLSKGNGAIAKPQTTTHSAQGRKMEREKGVGPTAEAVEEEIN